MIRKIQSIFSNSATAESPQDKPVTGADHDAAVEQKVKAIMARVFKIDINAINEGTSADDIERWTSIEHVDFLVNLQKEFEIELTDSQIVEMLSYPTVVENVTSALAAKKET